MSQSGVLAGTSTSQLAPIDKSRIFTPAAGSRSAQRDDLAQKNR